VTEPVSVASGRKSYPTQLSEIRELAHIGPSRFSALDRTLGIAGDFHRLRQHEEDRRWRATYMCASAGGLLRAAVPTYVCLARAWPDPTYSPATWSLPPGVTAACTPDRSVLVGGCADLRSGLHIDPEAEPIYLAQRVLPEVTRALPGRILIFPYVYAGDKEIIDRVFPERMVWTQLAREARFENISDPGREQRLGSRVRAVLNHDRRLLEKTGVVTSSQHWPAVASEASLLISDHNNRLGKTDNPYFVRMRYDQWHECAGVRVTVFTATCRGITGMLTALLWEDELDLREIGVNGTASDERLAVYLSLLFHQPLELAVAYGLNRIRCGIFAERPKASRGASFHPLYGGIYEPFPRARGAHGS
jgi:hypothetical protein